MIYTCYIYIYTYIQIHVPVSLSAGGAPAIWLVTLYNTRNIP